MASVRSAAGTIVVNGTAKVRAHTGTIGVKFILQTLACKQRFSLISKGIKDFVSYMYTGLC